MVDTKKDQSYHSAPKAEQQMMKVTSIDKQVLLSETYVPSQTLTTVTAARYQADLLQLPVVQVYNKEFP